MHVQHSNTTRNYFNHICYKVIKLLLFLTTKKRCLSIELEIGDTSEAHLCDCCLTGAPKIRFTVILLAASINIIFDSRPKFSNMDQIGSSWRHSIN